MKSKVMLISSIIASLLLVGCNTNNNEKKNDSAREDVPSQNSEVSSTNLNPSSIIESVSSNSESSRDSSSINSFSKPEPRRTVTEAEWKTIFSKSTFSNFEAYRITDGVGMLDYGENLFSMYISSLNYQRIYFDGDMFKTQTTIGDMAIYISKKEFHDYYLKSGMSTMLTEEAFLNILANTLKPMVGGGELVVGEELYQIVGSKTDAYPTYTKKNEKDSLLTNVIKFNEDEAKYMEISEFSDENELNIIYKFFEDLDKIANSYSSVKFDSNKNSYVIPTSVIMSALGIEDEGYEVTEACLTFADGQFENIEISYTTDEIYSYLQGGITYGLRSVGGVEFDVPTDLYECPHPLIAYCADDDYHYQQCDDCGSIIEFGKHEFKDGVCSCGHELLETEEITFDCCKNASVYVNRNAVTKVIKSVDVSGLEFDDHEDGTVTYYCDDEDCDLRIEETTTYGVAGSAKCERVTEYKYEFFDGSVAIHDPITYRNVEHYHNYVLVSMGDVIDGPAYFESDYTFYQAEVKCAHCGYEVPNACIYFDGFNFDEQFDYFTVQSLTEPTYFGEVKVPHNVKNGKCVYCEMSEEEIEEVYAISQFNMPFADSYSEVDMTTFLSTYNENNQKDLTQKYNKIKVSEYDGGYDLGTINKYIFNLKDNEFVPENDDAYDSFIYENLTNNAHLTAMNTKDLLDDDDYDFEAHFYIGSNYVKIVNAFDENTSNEMISTFYFTVDGCFAGIVNEYYGLDIQMGYVEEIKDK